MCGERIIGQPLFSDGQHGVTDFREQSVVYLRMCGVHPPLSPHLPLNNMKRARYTSMYGSFSFRRKNRLHSANFLAFFL